MPFWSTCTAMTSSVPVFHAHMNGIKPSLPEVSGIVLVMSGVTPDHPTCGLWLFNYFQGLLKPWEPVLPHIHVCIYTELCISTYIHT